MRNVITDKFDYHFAKTFVEWIEAGTKLAEKGTEIEGPVIKGLAHIAGLFGGMAYGAIRFWNPLSIAQTLASSQEERDKYKEEQESE